MPEFTKEEMEALKIFDQAKASASSPKPEQFTDEELTALAIFDAAKQNQIDTTPRSLAGRIGQDVLKGVGAVAEGIDRFSGATMARQALSNLATGEGPSPRFAQPTAQTPTGEQIAEQFGLSTEKPMQKPVGSFKGLTAAEIQGPEAKPGSSPAENVGLAIDVAADPTNLLPGVGPLLSATKRGAGAAGRGIGRGAGAVARKIPGSATATDIATDLGKSLNEIINPTIVPDFDELVAIAEKHGIAREKIPLTSEFGEKTFVGSKARQQAESTFSPELQKQFDEFQTEIERAVDKKIQEIGGGQAPPKPTEAGSIISDALDKGIDEAFEVADTSYNSLIKQNPQLTLSQRASNNLNQSLSGLRDEMSDVVNSSAPSKLKNQAEDVLRFIDDITNEQGNLAIGSFDKQVRNMRVAGKAAFSKAGSVAELDQRAFRKIYFSMRDALVDSVDDTLGRSVADDLKASNDIITEAIADRDFIESLTLSRGRDKAPEKIFQAMVTNSDTNRIALLKRRMKPEDLQKVKAAYLESLLKVNENNNLRLIPTAKSIQRNDTIVAALFDPDEIKEFNDLLTLGNSAGGPLNTSRTEVSRGLRFIRESISNKVVGDTVLKSAVKRGRDAARRSAIAPPTSVPRVIDQVQQATEITGFGAKAKNVGLSAIQRRGLRGKTPVEDIAKILQISAPQGQNNKNDQIEAMKRRLQQRGQ